MNPEWTAPTMDASLRTLSRLRKGPWSVFGYGVLDGATAEESEARLLREDIAKLLPEADPRIVLDREDLYGPAPGRARFQKEILQAIEVATCRDMGAPGARGDPSGPTPLGGSRRSLATLIAGLPSLLEDVDRTLLTPSRRPDPGQGIWGGTKPGGDGTPDAFSGKGTNVGPSPEATGTANRTPLVFIRRFEDLGSDAEAVAQALRQILVRQAHVVIPEGPLDTRQPAGREGVRLLLRVGELRGIRARERSIEGLRRRREEMKVYGPVPYGFTKEGSELRPVPELLAQTRRILDLGALDRSSIEIAASLNRDGLTWKDGTPWTWRRVHQVLRNPIYSSVLEGAPR